MTDDCGIADLAYSASLSGQEVARATMVLFDVLQDTPAGIVLAATAQAWQAEKRQAARHIYIQALDKPRVTRLFWRWVRRVAEWGRAQ